MTDTEFNNARMDQYYQNVDYNRAYARASKKRWRKAKKLGVEPSSLGPVESFFDVEIEKPEQTKMSEELKQHKRAQYYKYKTAKKNNINPTDLGDTSNFYHTEHRRYNKHGIMATKGKAYYDKWHYKTYGEELKLKDMAEYYADVEASRAYKRLINSRYRKAHKNDKKKTWLQKVILYIRKNIRGLRYYMTREEKAAYMHAYKKRMRIAKEKGVDPKTLTLSDFYDDEVAKVKRLESEERLGSIGKTKPEQIERNKEALRRAARKYYHNHKKERHAYYKKNKEQMKLKCFARYYGDIEYSRKRYDEARKRYYWKHKNDKTWWQKLISYIRGIKWTKIIRSSEMAH